MQIATVEVPEVYMGPVVELLGKRRGQMFDMQGLGYVQGVTLTDELFVEHLIKQQERVYRRKSILLLLLIS